MQKALQSPLAPTHDGLGTRRKRSQSRVGRGKCTPPMLEIYIATLKYRIAGGGGGWQLASVVRRVFRAFDASSGSSVSAKGITLFFSFLGGRHLFDRIINNLVLTTRNRFHSSLYRGVVDLHIALQHLTHIDSLTLQLGGDSVLVY